MISTVEPYDATVNPNYASAPDAHAYGHMRGITIHPWSANGVDFDKYFVTADSRDYPKIVLSEAVIGQIVSF